MHMLFILSCMCAQSYPTLATPWTVAHQTPLSMEFSKQEYWSGWREGGHMYTYG